MNPEAPPSIPPEAPIVGYCRACGKALDAASVHTAHGTIYCAEHVPGRTAAFPANGPILPMPAPYTANAPPPFPHSDVSPGVAFVLGLIPGVGAIYNGQYAKGLIHVFILGMLITLVSSNDVGGFEPLFGVLIPGFWAYMAFEAYHTAKLRQMGQPVDEFSSLVPGHGGSRFPGGAHSADRSGRGVPAEQPRNLRAPAHAAVLAGDADRAGSLHAVSADDRKFFGGEP